MRSSFFAISCCFCLCCNSLFGQLSAEVGASHTDTSPREILGWEADPAETRYGAFNDRFGYYAAANLTVCRVMSIRAKTGLNSYSARVYQDDAQSTDAFGTRYADVEAEQLFLEILPELQIGKQRFFFLNAGVGYQYAWKTNAGEYRVFDWNGEPISTTLNTDSHTYSLAANAGYQWNIKRFGLRLSYGRRYWKATRTGSTRIAQEVWQLGALYQLKK